MTMTYLRFIWHTLRTWPGRGTPSATGTPDDGVRVDKGRGTGTDGVGTGMGSPTPTTGHPAYTMVHDPGTWTADGVYHAGTRPPPWNCPAHWPSDTLAAWHCSICGNVMTRER